MKDSTNGAGRALPPDPTPSPVSASNPSDPKPPQQVGGAAAPAGTESAETVAARLSAKLAGTNRPATPNVPSETRALVVRLSDVQPEPVSWLWPGRIALGKQTLIAGDPGLGKSFITLDLAARVSSGAPWPDRRTEPNPAGGVVLLSAEDDVADTIRPRLDAAGADVTRINAIQGVEYWEPLDKKRRRRSFNLEQDMAALEAAIRNTPGCRLVVIDPVTAYLGKTDSHNNADIRGLLAPLSELAGRFRVALVAVTHLNKGGGANALYRAMGSLAFVAAARAAWLVVPDADNPKRRLFLCTKNNIGPDQGGLAYSLISSGSVAYVGWEAEPVTVTADEALGAVVRKGEQRKSGKVDEATEWLKERLAKGPVESIKLQSDAKDAGIAWASVKRARGKLGIVPRKLEGVKNGPWSWELPKSDSEKPSPPNDQDAQETLLVQVEQVEQLERLRLETPDKKAAEWLTQQLAKGPVPSVRLESDAKASGIPWASVRRARGELGIVLRKLPKGPSVWALPDATSDNPADPKTEGAQQPLAAQVEQLEQVERLGAKNGSETSEDAQDAQGAQEVQGGTDAQVQPSQSEAAEWTA